MIVPIADLCLLNKTSFDAAPANASARTESAAPRRRRSDWKEFDVAVSAATTDRKVRLFDIVNVQNWPAALLHVCEQPSL